VLRNRYRNENSILLLLVPALLVEFLDRVEVRVFHGVTGS